MYYKFEQDGKKIKNLCFNLLGKDNVILIHYGGSIAYNLVSQSSDYDVLAITKKWVNLENVKRHDNSFQLLCLKGLDQMPKLDLFVIDYESAIKIHNLDKNTSQYVRLFIDSALCLEETLIYRNESFKKEYSEFKNLDLEEKIVPYYKNILDYYNNLYYHTSPYLYRKHEYHIFRFLDNFDRFRNTGIYSPTAYGKNFSKLLRFKNATDKDYDRCLTEFVEAKEELENKLKIYESELKH
ncbi:hypothetical protein ERK19_04985 [Lactobacillus helsingborgensis]|uniref:hypothetical protein n=1 Tax=Lactobacillus helsingborgensis TaxID=1218494 RepID=UPI00164F173C|nr:hypothetical protein [Lactobacillus helsingborgensis]MBC6356705.1 hypothetical protein [Lactobacillus helsingborgensis]